MEASDESDKLLREIVLKAARYCSYQERYSFDVRNKLRRLQVPPEMEDLVLEELKRENYVNDLRFLETYCRSKFNNNSWGKYKIAQHLRFKGFDEQSIAQALTGLDNDTYLAKVKLLIQKKLPGITGKNISKKQKLFNYLRGKGYEIDFISQAMKELGVE